MRIKSLLIKPYAAYNTHLVKQIRKNALRDQEACFHYLIQSAKHTRFGQDHNFSEIRSVKDFHKRVPLRDYEGLRQWVDLLTAGEADILWPGKPKYFAKTSGTTSGVKYIPITKESMPTHIASARHALMHYASRSGNSQIFDGKMIFVSGSPELTDKSGIPTGRLSGIVNHEIPSWLTSNQLPSFETNCIDDWEEKLDAIVRETVHEDMRLISGIPPWVQMYYERLLEVTGKSTIKEIFPNFSLFMYGGVNFEPYRAKLEELVGGRVDSVETYPASEGFIAFQDTEAPELLLNTNAGIFYEFVPVEEVFSDAPTRLSLHDVELGKDYAVIINNNAGLWGYNIGDSVRFVSKNPYRLLVSGRIKHYISAFGEHVIGKEVEESILSVANQQGIRIVEFTVAPQVNPPQGELPYHEWLVAFDSMPENMEAFAQAVDREMTKQNIYYEDLIAGKILQPLKITPLQADAFRLYMKNQGKLGGQNKVPRLSNDRKIADAISQYKL
jgi:hypothetical protein